MVFKNGVKSIQTAGYNGACTVYDKQLHWFSNEVASEMTIFLAIATTSNIPGVFCIFNHFD